MEKLKLSCAVGVIALLSAGIVLGQVTTGTIAGTVKDSTGAVLSGAKVVLLSEETGIARSAQTDASGRYSVSSLSLGNYRVTATLEGFQTEVRTGITLTVAQEAVVDLVLPVGAVTQTVEVAGEAPVIETTTATLSGLVDEGQIRDLPLNGRSYADLAQLSPGVLFNGYHDSTGSEGFGQRLSVNGSRADANLYLLDGTVVNDSAGNSATADSMSLGVEAIREFRLLTHSFSAEYGRNSGAVVSAVTRSGTNHLHGSVYEFVRNNLFDARDFFNVGALPGFQRNQFGAAVGGPVLKDRIFFFANYEGLRQRQGDPIVIAVPDANARKGLLPSATTGVLQSVPFSPAVAPYLALFPLPNGRSLGGGEAQYNSDFSEPTTEDYALERMDFRLSDKDNFYWRYVFDPSSSAAPNAVPIFESSYFGTHHFVGLGETHIFSGTALNEFRFAFNRTFLAGNSASLINLSPSLSFIPGEPFGTLAISSGINSTNSGALPQLGNDHSQPIMYLQNLFQETDTFSLIRGRHSLKFGADLERIQFNQMAGQNAWGDYSFNGLANLLAGTPNSFAFALIGGNSSRERGFRQILFAWFLQDDFRINSKLTLNVGLRQEFLTNPSEVEGKTASLINITDMQSTFGAPFETSKENFAPRVGLAWDPTGSGKTAVRVGAGLFYNQVEPRVWGFQAGSENQFYGTFSIKNNVQFPYGVPAVIPAQLHAESTIEFHLPTPTVTHYNVEIQRQLSHAFNLRLGYVGSYGYNMTRLTNQDVPIPTTLANGSLLFAPNAPLVNPNFASISQLRADAVDNYNGFQSVLQKTIGSGLMFQASYTYAKALSESDQAASRQVDNVPGATKNIFNLAGDYGRSGYDQRHTFVFNSSYKMPWDHLLNKALEKNLLGGWEVNGIVAYGSGLPFNVGIGYSDYNTSYPTPGSPSVAPGASNNPTKGTTAGCTGIPSGQKLRTPTLWYDPCAFVSPATGTFGNLGRNTVQGPGTSTVNFTLIKMTAITEKKQLEFRAELFNLFNHPSFYLPNNSVFSSNNGVHNGTEGIITSTTSRGRQIQLGLKLIF